MKRVVLAFAIVSLLGGFAQAQSLRSDSPLWTYQNERDAGLYPEFFYDDDMFGCIVPFRTGDYRRIAAAEGPDDLFIHVGLVGLTHCALAYGQTHIRDDVTKAFDDVAWLIDLGKVRGSEDRLFALQIGIHDGSRYILLRQRGSGLPSLFDELDWACPSNAERRVAQIDVWRQDVCVVSSKAQLLRIARTATRRPAVASWEPLHSDEDGVPDDQDD